MAADRSDRVVVVGAGIGGLVSALLLASQGVQVTLVEAADAPGGKMRRLPLGEGIDGGPTVFTMRWVFEQILEQAGFAMADLPRLAPLGVLARHAWRGHEKRLDLFADHRLSFDAIAAFAGVDEARRFEGFCRQAREVYRRLEGPYIRAGRPSLFSMGRDLGPQGLATLVGLGPFSSLWSSLARHFRDPRLQQLFGRYATYCGASLAGAGHADAGGRRWSSTASGRSRAACMRWRSASPNSQRAAARRCATRAAASASSCTAAAPRACGWPAARRSPRMRWSSTATRRPWCRGCSARRRRAPCRRCRAATVRCRRSPGRSTGARRGSRWCATTSSSTTTMPASSTTSSAPGSCRGTARSTSARRTAATPVCTTVPSGCCAWSMRRPRATGANSTPRRWAHANNGAWTC